MTHANGRNGEFVFEHGEFSSYGEPDRIWIIVKEMPGYKIINLINFTGINSDLWKEPKTVKPQFKTDICVKALVDEKVKRIFAASPDIEDGRPQELKFEYIGHARGRQLVFNIPELQYWTLVCIEVK
jgi:dextranase